MTAPAVERTDFEFVDRYGLGFAVLFTTVMLSCFPELAREPERYIDVPRPEAFRMMLHVAGYFLQMSLGLWLSLSLVFDAPRWRRVAALLWPVSVLLYFAPLPGVLADVALAPAMLASALGLAAFSRTLERATRLP